MRNFDFEEERIKQEIARLEAKSVLIQLPEGLKPQAPSLSRLIEKTGVLTLISADPCYGACDLATGEAGSLGIDLIVHYGHSRQMKYERVPTLYIEARSAVNVDKAIENAIPLVERWCKIGLATTVQHVQALDFVRETLTRAGKMVVVGDAGHLTYPGQVIGCDYSNVRSIARDVEAFLFVGGGLFHALGLVLSTMKPTIVADPYEGRAFSVCNEAERVIRQRWACIEEAKKARDFGVLIGLKPGQKRLEQAVQTKRRLEAKGKSVYLFTVDEITPEALREFPTIEAYVNTACPRISFDEASRFQKPVLTLNEVSVVVGDLSWEELCRKGLLEG